jgi:hypothetical protein
MLLSSSSRRNFSQVQQIAPPQANGLLQAAFPADTLPGTQKLLASS